VVIGEQSSLQEHVRIGELVLPLTAVRGDDSHLSYADPDIPAVADSGVARAVRIAAETNDEIRTVHTGTCWSCGAGAGIFDPLLVEHAWYLKKAGVLGNAVEAATAYLLGAAIGLRVASLWLTADSLFEPITWRRPCPRLNWEDGWKPMVEVALEALASLEEA
jgi:AMP nucleosidase